MEQFAGYGFNKSHSAAYAYLAYVTAYLKAHYPLEFMSALLTSETGNTAKVVKYINECRDMGIQVLPPDVNKSDKDFTPDGECDPLRALRDQERRRSARSNRSSTARDEKRSVHVDLQFLRARRLERRQPARDRMPDQGRRHGFAERHALAAVRGDRLRHGNGQRAQRDKLSGQTGLFAMASGAEEDHSPEQPPAQSAGLDWRGEAGEREGDARVLRNRPSLWISGRTRFANWPTQTSDTSGRDSRGRGCRLCGMMTGIQRRRNKEGKPWAMFHWKTRSGAIECMVFTTSTSSFCPMLNEDQAVLVRGMALPEEGAPTKVSVKDIIPLEVARVRCRPLISIKVRLGANGTDKARSPWHAVRAQTRPNRRAAAAGEDRGTSRLFWM